MKSLGAIISINYVTHRNALLFMVQKEFNGDFFPLEYLIEVIPCQNPASFICTFQHACFFITAFNHNYNQVT